MHYGEESFHPNTVRTRRGGGGFLKRVPTLMCLVWGVESNKKGIFSKRIGHYLLNGGGASWKKRMHYGEEPFHPNTGRNSRGGRGFLKESLCSCV